MKLITSLEELQVQLDEAEQQQKVSDDAFRKSVSEWYLSPEIIGDVPSDPLSSEYKNFQLALYQSLTSRPYQVENEETEFSFEYEIRQPYPYGTKSPRTVGDHLIGYGWLIKKMGLPVPARILEIGSGYGSLTYHLASMGYEVTCLDMSEPLLNFVKARTADLSVPVKIICGDMVYVPIDEKYEAVVFNASLHHTVEHQAMIKRLDEIVAPGGIIAFAAEPIVPDDSIFVPYPWGICLKGLSIWSICKYGWLELGFQESYFVSMLKNAGWSLTRCHLLPETGQTDVWLASKNGRSRWPPAIQSERTPYNIDAEAEIIRLKALVEGYENGRVIRLINWLKTIRHNTQDT